MGNQNSIEDCATNYLSEASIVVQPQDKWQMLTTQSYFHTTSEFDQAEITLVKCLQLLNYLSNAS